MEAIHLKVRGTLARRDTIDARARAVTAFAILLLHYTRDDSIAIRIDDDDAPWVHVMRGEAQTIGSFLDEVRARLCGAVSPPSPYIDLHWRETDAEEAGARLSLRLRLGTMTLDPAGSIQRGLLTVEGALARVDRHLRRVLSQLARSPARKIGEVRLLDSDERSRLLVQLARSERVPELEAPGLLHSIFETRAKQVPDHVALECRGETMTYRELDAKTSSLAAKLRARGIETGDFVAFQLPRSLDVYIAMLAILKAGAAYVPIDPESPRDRVLYMLSDCGASALLTVTSLAPPGELTPCSVIALDTPWHASDRIIPEARPSWRPPSPHSACYVIYTSGSTGAPKGVVIEHRSAAHLVRAEQLLFGVRSEDRVFQGFTASFDAAVEEIWLAFAAGATLVAGMKDDLLSDLATFLVESRVTVFSTVPTLLATIDRDLPGVRILILGGETCPTSLARRWATDSRALWNTYGPTEATVIATYARLRMDGPVTIGRPIANCAIYILDGVGEPAPEGAVGEIHIGGIGLARGYTGKPGLTAERFVKNRFAGDAGAPEVLYRTGDLGRFTPSGEIAFVGRVDDQVKLRGFRVELGEIEAALLASTDVAAAVVVVREGAFGAKELVAYAVPRGSVTVDSLRRHLFAKLPSYMVPAKIELMTELPTLPSGKVDKRSLPPPGPASHDAVCAEPRGPLEGKLARAWIDVLGVERVGRDEDFFLDLGGHSLLVAQMVSRLRADPELAHFSVLDVYEHRTIERIAAFLAASGDLAPARQTLPSAAPRRWAYTLCAAAQAGSMYGLFAIHATQWLAPYLAYAWLHGAGFGAWTSLCGAAAILFAIDPLLLIVAAAAKWLIIGRYRPGRYPLFGLYYFRFWVVERLFALAPTSNLVGTPLLGAYYRVLGARVGRNVHLGSDCLFCFDLATLGDDAAIGADADLSGYTVEDGELVIGPVWVGARCAVGTRSVLSHGAVMQDDASLGELSLVPAGTTIPACEHWAGSPAAYERAADDAPIARPVAWRHAVYSAACAVAVALLPAFVIVALLPGLLSLYAAEHRWGAWYLLGAPIAAVSFVVLLCLEIAIAKWIFVGKLKPGRYPLHGLLAFRHWVFERAMDQSLDVIGGLYATLFLNPWLRLLGVRIGAHAEISTASIGGADLLQVGDGAFVADCASMGEPRVARGWIELDEVRVGARTFVGNSAVVPAGTTLPDDCLVGCLSMAPSAVLEDLGPSASAGTSWVGSPAVLLPQRQVSTAFPTERTHRPSRSLVAQRYAMDSLRVILPTTCIVVITCLLIKASLLLSARLSAAAFIATFPLLLVAAGVAAACFVIACKWLVIGRYRRGERPLWCSFVWRSELVTALHENLADPLLNEFLEGTPFLAWFFRALGTKIGKRVYMATSELTEYDLVSIGDEACLNAECTLQTHLFEDRVMKISTVSVGPRCTVGTDAVVLYDTHMEEGSVLAPLSLLMKGEALPAGSRWQGSPARPAARRK